MGNLDKTSGSKRATQAVPLPAEVRLDELYKVWGGMNRAAQIRDGGYSARNLNLDDLSYYLHNRRRVLQGKKAHTPQEWLEAER